MVKDSALNNVVALSQFQVVDRNRLSEIEGGVVPLIVIGGIAISKGAAITGGLFASGIGVGYFLSK